MANKPPKPEELLNELAWLRATCPEAKARNGRRAVGEALQACTLSNWMKPGYVNTLAAAYAEAGQFEKAVNFEWFAISLMAEEETTLADAGIRLRMYEKRQAYRETEREKQQRKEQPISEPSENEIVPRRPILNGPVGSA